MLSKITAGRDVNETHTHWLRPCSSRASSASGCTSFGYTLAGVRVANEKGRNTGLSSAVAKLSTNGFASRYLHQPRAGFKRPNGLG